MQTDDVQRDEVEIDEQLVRGLLKTQFPEYGAMAIRPVSSAGTDHAMFRVGPELVARLPRIAGAGEQVHREQKWLPLLADHVPLPIPTPVALGIPGGGFPMHWSVYRWLEGENAFDRPIADLQHAAVGLGRFGAALRQVDAPDGPPSPRGGPLALQETDVLAAINDLSAQGLADKNTALRAWKSIISLPQWVDRPAWTHGDLLPSNILTRAGRLSAVVDFGCVGVGDPACDMMIGWTLFTGKERAAFREHSEVDDATWDRGRGWAFGFGLMAYHYHQETNPILAAVALRSVSESLADFST